MAHVTALWLAGAALVRGLLNGFGWKCLQKCILNIMGNKDRIKKKKKTQYRGLVQIKTQ